MILERWVDPIIFELAELFSIKRLSNLQSWAHVGLQLKKAHPELLSLWIDISEKTEKFNAKTCKKVWKLMIIDDKIISNNHVLLHDWAQLDSPLEYAILMKEIN